MTGDYYDATWPPPLSDNDREILEHGSAIRTEVINAREYFTLIDKRDLPRIMHRQANGKVPCLVVPLHSVDGKTITYQIRPHNTSSVIPVKVPKYLMPNGARLIVDCNPIALSSVLDKSTELWITEGAKKADSAISHGLACVSISGVDCWQQGKVPLQDWYQIPLKDRKVILAFDSDSATNPHVYFALLRCSKFLQSRGAVVHYVYLSDYESDKNGEVHA